MVQGRLHAEAGTLAPDALIRLQTDTLIKEAIASAAMEGEQLQSSAVRSAVERRIGLRLGRTEIEIPSQQEITPVDRAVYGIADMLYDAVFYHAEPLTADRLKGWQAAQFPTGFSGISRITVGDWRGGPGRVVSGSVDREIIHYEAPPADRLNTEVGRFLDWWEVSQLTAFEGAHSDRAAQPAPPADPVPSNHLVALDGLVRAALANFWFLSIHPFEKGNGRIARAVREMALCQDEQASHRLYSLSAQIMDERDLYYEVLERAQRGDGDITGWMIWFMGCLQRSILSSEGDLRLAGRKTKLMLRCAEIGLNTRQRLVVRHLLDADPAGNEPAMTNRACRDLTGASRETAKRDLAGMVHKGLLARNPGGGRGASYRLVWPNSVN